MKHIVIGADIVPTESNVNLFCQGDVEQIVGEELYQFFSHDSYLICNLETPLVEEASPIIKCGPSFATPIKAVFGLKKLGVDLISLANNHIKDQGESGIISTCQAITKENLCYVGVGENEQRASKPFIFSFNGKTIGVYSCAEHEFSSASKTGYGANTYDARFSLDHISSMTEKCDYVIVLYHGGKEYYRYPSPDLQKTCRCFCDKGANLVICQHSHCIGAEEKYRDCTIVYGQGNFIFNKVDNEFWNSSLLICIDEAFNINYMPIIRTDVGTRLATEDERKQILEDFRKRSNDITFSGFIEKEYTVFSRSILDNYLAVLSGKKSRLWFAINKLTKGKLFRIIYRKKYSKKQLAMIKNYIECEAHRELIIKAIDDELNCLF